MLNDKNSIRTHFQQNIDRIDNLLETYGNLTGTGKGRVAVRHQDLPRAAVTFLHAALEDVVRSIVRWKLPNARTEYRDAFKGMSLPGTEKDNFTIGDLLEYRGQEVGELIEDAVDEHLERSNFNSPEEIERYLESCGFPENFLTSYKPQLAPMMKRRHWIVHRMDANYTQGSGEHAARSINERLVSDWQHAVQNAVDDILAQV